MGHYKSNVRDLEFNLFEVLGLEQPLSEGVWGDLDADTVRNMLSEVARLAEGPLGESFADATATLRSSTPRTTPSPCRNRSRSRSAHCGTPSGTAWDSPRRSAASPSPGPSCGPSVS